MTKSDAAQIQRNMDAVEQMVSEFHLKLAEALLSCGMRLIPSEYLDDDQLVVSERLYQAAKKLAQEKKTVDNQDSTP